MDREEGEVRMVRCYRCLHVGLEECDGFYYCQNCNTQAEDMILTGIDDEHLVEGGRNDPAIYSTRNSRRLTQSSQADADPNSTTWRCYESQPNDNNNHIKVEYPDIYGDGVGPTEPEDFGKRELKYDDYYNEVRIRYLLGIQWMIQLQCEALVDKFKVTPLICGIASSVWLRFLAGTGVCKDTWANDVLQDFDSQIPDAQLPEELEEEKRQLRYPNEPRSAFGQRAVMLWFRYLRKAIPLHHSLAISFLACHVAREAVLPTDILKWSLEGKLPYFAAHVEIEKRFERPSPACRISSSLMFRPTQAFPAQKLESAAATIAESTGLHLPPVNFYEIALRYLRQLSLPVEKILPHACRIFEWSMPPELWLSTNELRLPSRVCVLSILIVAIRIVYKINGFGAWEESLTNHRSNLDSRCDSKMRDDDDDYGERGSGSPHKLDDSDEKSVRNALHVQKSDTDSSELLHSLYAKYNEISDTYEYTKDLPSYLQYCKDVVFSGGGSSHANHHEDELIEKLWDFYQNEKYSDPEEDVGAQSGTVFSEKRSRIDNGCAKNYWGEKNTGEGYRGSQSAGTSTYHAGNDTQQSLDNDNSSHVSLGERNSESNTQVSAETSKEKTIRQLKLDMEESRFCYIPPRVNLKRFDYLHYVRKKDDGALIYVAHADYYILLRAFARIAQVDTRIMHIGVLSFERRLAWLEKRISHCLHLTPPSVTCEFCGDVPGHSEDDAVGLSQLSL